MHDKLTKEDIKKMEEEILHRKLVVRKECLEAVKEARAHGDLSENFEYHAAKKEKNRNESRIRYLERMIRTAQVIEDQMQEDEVGLNKEVEVYFEEDDETEIFKMVTTVRVDTMKGYISMESPIGKAIFGKKTGDRVFVKINDNLGYYVQIKSVKPLAEEDKGNLLEY
ncbi:MAG: transcription elongation factor GreA [Lachnospiraceae bacterium]|nr:transcription elongation factor GreA [Lachnospiraceae bacterium]